MSPTPTDALEAEVTPEELAQRLVLLQGVSIFFALPDTNMRRLARLLRRVVVPAGTEVVSQGFVADRMYLIASGRCEVRAASKGAHHVTVSLLVTGDFFGLSSMKEGVPQPASVTATERSELLELLATDLETVLRPGSPVRVEMEKLVQQRRAAIDDVLGRAHALGSGGDAHLIAVYSAKGGSGKTTLAVNMAAALSQRHRGECVLLDLGLPFNHAALTANVVPTGCLAALDAVPDDDLEEMLLSACAHHSSGLMVLPGALRVEQSELITPYLVQRALTALERNFHYIVVDLGVSISETVLTVLERATKVVLVLTPEVTAMRDAKDMIELMRSVLNVPESALALVLNRPRPSTLVDTATVETTLGRSLDFDLEHDGPRVDKLAVTGDLLVVAASTTPLAKKLRSLAALAAQEDEAPVKVAR